MSATPALRPAPVFSIISALRRCLPVRRALSPQVVCALVCAAGAVMLAPASAKARMSIRPAGYGQLHGWAGDKHGSAFATFYRSCRRGLSSPPKGNRLEPYLGWLDDWVKVCAAAVAIGGRLSDAQARDFFERHFEPVEVIDDDNRPLFTGYFEPEVEGALKPGGPYRYPLLRKPPDLVRMNGGELPFGRMVNGRPTPYLTREEIERGGLGGHGLELVWLKSRLDAFFVHIQGSTRVALAGGGTMRVGFAGKNGHPYSSIGRTLIDWGEMTRDQASMQSIRRWLERHPERADRLMWTNKSYIFFREIKNDDPRLGPVGAQGVALTPGRSMAVDKRYYLYGAPLWLETETPRAGGGTRSWRRLMIAQDTGSAIKGPVRGDIFFGSGHEAGAIAGRMKSPGRVFLLRPRAARGTRAPVR